MPQAESDRRLTEREAAKGWVGYNARKFSSCLGRSVNLLDSRQFSQRVSGNLVFDSSSIANDSPPRETVPWHCASHFLSCQEQLGARERTVVMAEADNQEAAEAVSSIVLAIRLMNSFKLGEDP